MKAKKDVYNHHGRYTTWKENALKYGVDEVNEENSSIILQFVLDMEVGRNIAKGSKKGPRSHIRLNTIRDRLTFTAKQLESRGVSSLYNLTDDDVMRLFNDMRTGIIRKIDGGIYKSVTDYVKVFKAFWHWHMKVSRGKNINLQDITEDLDVSREENNFVYFTLEELHTMLPYFTTDEQLRMLLMFDTIIRSPTELMSLRVFDIAHDVSELTIREETSKTYGRTIKLLLCKKELKKHLQHTDKTPDDYLFEFTPNYFNTKLKKVAAQLFGTKMTKGGKPFSSLTMYDFRHSGACHWRTGAYRSKIDALMYRGGWSDIKMLNYYTKKIGMKDTIEEQDLLVDVDKNALEKKIFELQTAFAKSRQRDKLLFRLLQKPQAREVLIDSMENDPDMMGLFAEMEP